MAYRNNEPYDDLPILPPAAAVETARVLRVAVRASRVLAKLKGAGCVIPKQIAKRDAASEHLQELEKIGVLQSERRGREVLYRHPALLEVLKT